jgi:hypothetical protein
VIQIVPSSTTVGLNQGLSFQISGGTPPYQFSDSGVGSVSSSGYYEAGASTGQAQVYVTDANGNTGSATISVVSAAANVSLLSSGTQTKGWSLTSAADLKLNPLVRGQLIGVEDHGLQADGESVQSKYLVTELKHPVVRVDELLDGNTKVAVRALIEDQFLVTLQQGFSDSDLLAILSPVGARISKKLSSNTYLVSMSGKSEIGPSGISADFMSKREQLKQELKTIAQVTPHYVSRAPSQETAPR